MSKNELTFAVAPNGKITSIYDDRLADFLKAGRSTVTRASHVEPAYWVNTNPPRFIGWIVDMTPAIQELHLDCGCHVCDVPTKLGPFATREEALAAEHRWLEERMFGEA